VVPGVDDRSLFIAFVRDLLRQGWKVYPRCIGPAFLYLPGADRTGHSGLDDRFTVHLDRLGDDDSEMYISYRAEAGRSEHAVAVTSVQQGIDVFVALTGYGLEWTSGFRAGFRAMVIGAHSITGLETDEEMLGEARRVHRDAARTADR